MNSSKLCGPCDHATVPTRRAVSVAGDRACQALFMVLALLLCLAGVHAAESDGVTPWRQDQPPNEPYSPQEAISRMSVPDGFTVELVASEPEVVNPIAMSFDDRGRIWITEGIEYPRKPAGGK